MKKSELETNMRLTFSKGRTGLVLLDAALTWNKDKVRTFDILRYEDRNSFDYLSIMGEDCTHRRLGALAKVEVLAGGGKAPQQIWPIEVRKLTISQIANELGYPFELVDDPVRNKLI